MNVGVVGLGLIGGSLAKAYKKTGEHTVLGVDKEKTVTDFAKMAGAIDGELDEEHFGNCDVIFLAIRPGEVIKYLKRHCERFPKDALVIDCAGTKRQVCKEGFAIGREYGFTFVGGHPMAGKQYSGFKYARESLFKDASMIIVPPDHNNLDLIGRIKEIMKLAGFGKIKVTSAETHDKIIAFTSQLAHVVSNAFIKSPTATEHRGFSAGSYNDMTRVAFLDEEMWTELFMGNKDNLVCEIQGLIEQLEKYKEALKGNDEEVLKALLREGKAAKLEVDGRCR